MLSDPLLAGSRQLDPEGGREELLDLSSAFSLLEEGPEERV